MTDAFTSIATAGGYSTYTVTQAYDLLFRKALNALPKMRSFVDVRPEQVTHTGSSVRLQLDQPFSESVVTAAKTALNEESDPDSVQMPATTYVDFTPNEYGLYTKRTRKLAKRSMVEIDPRIAWAVADNCNKVLDELIQDVLVAATNKYYATGTTVAAQDASNPLTADDVRRIKLQLEVAQSMAWDGQFYAASVHPDVLFDLRRETGSGGWRVPNEYGSSQTKIWNGEFGEFEGVRFQTNARARTANDGAAGAKVHRSYFFGKEALGEIVVTEPGLVIGPYTDAFMRFRKVGWYGDIGWSIFRQESLVVAFAGTAA